MYTTILVNDDIEHGRRLLVSLETMLHVTAAFWFHFDEENQWRLVVVSPDVSEKGPRELYTAISTLLNDWENHPKTPLKFPFDRIMLVSPNSLLYKMVKQRSGPRTGPVREGLSLDAYIYKMA